MPGERSREICGRERTLRQETVDGPGRRVRLKEEHDNRTVYTRAVQMDVRLEDAGDVVDVQAEMHGTSVFVHPEDGASGGQRGARGRRAAGDDLASTRERRLEPFVPGNNLPSDLAARMAGQGVHVDVGIAAATIGQEFRERMAKERPAQAGCGDGSRGELAIDLAGRHSGIEEGDDDRAVDPGAVEVDMRRKGPRQVGAAQGGVKRLPLVAQLAG